MATQVNVHRAKTDFSALISRAISGERIIIAKADKPVAELEPLSNKPAKRVLGRNEGKGWISPNFDDPIPELEEYF
jgi:antitoxin (DNA-binding transcriptional repressor) of toxin-antitoxin stability system